MKRLFFFFTIIFFILHPPRIFSDRLPSYTGVKEILIVAKQGSFSVTLEIVIKNFFLYHRLLFKVTIKISYKTIYNPKNNPTQNYYFIWQS